MVEKRNLTQRLQDFFLTEGKVRSFQCEEDKVNISLIADDLGIGCVEFSEQLGEAARRSGKEALSAVFYGECPDAPASRQDFVQWKRETFGGTFVIFTVWAKEGVHWTQSERHMVELFAAGFGVIKKGIYLRDGLIYTLTHDSALRTKNMNYGTMCMNGLLQSGRAVDYSVFFMNVNGTGEMNNQIGRDNGTKVMRGFVLAMEDIMDESEAAWRIGGDNFGAVIHNDKVDRLLAILCGTPVQYGPEPDEIFRISATAGICRCGNEFHSVDTIFDAAQSCMNMARFSHHVPYLFYDRNVVQMLESNRHVEIIFPEALEQQEFRVFYQPKVSLITNRVVGAEALCRWIRDGKVIPPDSFIPVLERSKRVCELDMYMLDHTCRDIREWIDNGGTPVEISTNFSRRHLNNPFLARQIVQTIDKYDLPHELLIVELTETTDTAHMKRMGELVYKLKDEGIRTSVDDFGMGYSSMSMLRDIPFSELKIDRSFLTYTRDTRDRSAVMMKHVISMANELGMNCIAEGVETPDQIRMLKEMECLRAQGFYFDRPLPKEEFEKRLQEGSYTDRSV